MYKTLFIFFGLTQKSNDFLLQKKSELLDRRYQNEKSSNKTFESVFLNYPKDIPNGSVRCK